MKLTRSQDINRRKKRKSQNFKDILYANCLPSSVKINKETYLLKCLFSVAVRNLWLVGTQM